MKKVINASFAISLVLLASSCTKKYYDIDDRQQIRLSSYVTLAGQPRIQETQIAAGQSLSLFVTPASTTSEILYSNVSITADGSGGFNYAIPMYYPVDGRNIDFYAVHPYGASATLTAPLTYSILSDQSVQANFLNSDLLYAVRTDIGRTANPVSLLFTHKLSKIDFIIKTTDNIDLGALNGVTVLNVLPQTTIDLPTGDITTATGTPVNVSAYGVTGSSTVRAEVSGISAIVIPQTIAASTPLFRINIGQQAYTYTTPATGDPISFSSGNNYKLELTISGSEIQLSSTITPWDEGGTIIGGLDPE